MGAKEELKLPGKVCFFLQYNKMEEEQRRKAIQYLVSPKLSTPYKMYWPKGSVKIIVK